MRKVQWKPGNMLFPVPAVIITCGTDEQSYNAITIAWTGTICTNPPMTYISLRKNRYSYSIIKEQMGFVINLTTEELAYATDYCGVRSGANENKLEKLKLTYRIGDRTKSPLLDKSPVNIECKVVEIKELGSHDMFIAEVVNVYVDEQYIDKNNQFNLFQSKPICYNHGKYFGLGKYVGKFGYSVEKKKNKKANLKNKTKNRGKYKNS